MKEKKIGLLFLLSIIKGEWSFLKSSYTIVYNKERFNMRGGGEILKQRAPWDSIELNCNP
jgi:hypothetical protein